MRVIKRNGNVVEFDKMRIINAITKAMSDIDIVNNEIAYDIADKIENTNVEQLKVEEIERQVVKELYLANLDEVADAYSEYKAHRKLIRQTNETKYNGKFLSSEFLSKYKHKSNPFPTELGKFVYYRTYSRPIPEEKRREDWWETVYRVVEFNSGLQLDAMKRQGVFITDDILTNLKTESEEIYDLMYNLKLFPSGRSLWIGGTKSSKMYSLSNFNCSFVTIDELKKFSEIFFVLMLGTGVGLSVERKYVKKLPKINSKIEVIHKSYNAVPKNERKEYTELKQVNSNAIELEIGDSKFGWSNAIDMYFDIISSKQYTDIEYIFINYNNVRPEGERLKTFGGYASGYKNIQTMFTKIDRIFKDKRLSNSLQWQTVKPIDCLDIATIIAENVVSGGVRRSAEIVFCDSDETEVLTAKSNLYYQDENGNWISNDKILNRMLSNNTVLYQQKPTREELHNHFEKLKVSGEPAFGNFEEMKRRREDVQGGNPCQPLGEFILTPDGYRKIEEIKDKIVLNGKTYESTSMFSTGKKMVYEVTLDNGSKTRFTGNHKLTQNYNIFNNRFNDVELDNLKVGDYVSVDYTPVFDTNISDLNEYEKGIIAGWFIADGGFSVHHKENDNYSVGFCVGNNEFDYLKEIESLVQKYYEPDFKFKQHTQSENAYRGRIFKNNIIKTIKEDLGITDWNKFNNKIYLKNSSFKLGYLRALFTCDGHSCGNEVAGLTSVNYEFLEEAQRYLKEFGIYSDIRIHSKESHKIAKDGKIRNNKITYILRTSDVDFDLIGFLTNYKNNPMNETIQQRYDAIGSNHKGNIADILKKKKYQQIVSIEPIGEMDVYDITVDVVHHYNTNGMIVHNCFEILLRDRGVCNLTEVNLMGFVNEDGTYNKEELLKAQKYSARIGYRMASIELELHEWDLVNQEDRLTGCSITGVMDFKNATNISDVEFAQLLRELRIVAKYSANELADLLHMNKPKLVTAIKPSGTISQLPTISSGVHFSHSPYYIRRVRVNAQDPLAKAMEKSGFNWSPEVGQTVENHKTKVFEFPIKAPNGRTKYDVSAIEQLELYKTIMENYVDHNASNTIHVRENEWDEVEQWVFDNWDSIVGVTFLSLDDSFYQLLPYESITKEEFEDMVSKQPKFNPSILKELEKFDEEFDILDADCDSGICPVR